MFGYKYWINPWDLIEPIMTFLLFTNGVIDKVKNPKIDIGSLCYLTILPSRLFPQKLEHGQFQVIKWNLNSFAITHLVLFSERQHVQVCWLCWRGYS
jgi:hypothetical protein